MHSLIQNKNVHNFSLVEMLRFFLSFQKLNFGLMSFFSENPQFLNVLHNQLTSTLRSKHFSEHFVSNTCISLYLSKYCMHLYFQYLCIKTWMCGTFKNSIWAAQSVGTNKMQSQPWQHHTHMMCQPLGGVGSLTFKTFPFLAEWKWGGVLPTVVNHCKTILAIYSILSYTTCSFINFHCC